MTSVCQATPPNQFELPENRATHPRRLQFVNRSPGSDHWKQAECISYPLVKESFEDQRCKRTIKPASHPSSVQSNQFRGNQTSALPLFLPGSVQDNLSCSRSDLLSPQDFRTASFNADSSPTESKPRENNSRYLLM